MILYEEFKNGERVILDERYHNSSLVKVVAQTRPNRVYTTVEDDYGQKWDVMTNRLTKIDK